MSRADMAKLVKLLEKQFGLAWVDVMAWLRESNGLDAIEARIIAGDWAGAVASLDGAALKVAAEAQASYELAGRKAADWLDGKVAGSLVRFDTADAPIVRRARENQLELVQGFRDEHNRVAQQIARRAMIEGAQGGINPRAVARDFRDSIGLTAYQESVVSNYRRALERGDYAKAMGYELRDGRGDKSLRAAMRDGKSLTSAQVDKMAEAYRKNAVAHRATTIARTEALRNAEDGTSDAYRQAIQRGDVDADELVKTWHAGPRTRDARDAHQSLDGESVRIGEDFQLPDGVKMTGPGDPRGGAVNVVNCRCTSSVSLRA